ncbi:MAG: hypothetical protein RL033_6053 [Pseudomonadota bacterium]|jgi:serine/threonine-protein kinase
MRAVLPPPSFSSDVATGVTFGSYVVGELIGRGAMASVYRAEHVMLNKAVALKLMDRALLDSPGARERFLREGRVVASITHPNVVNITDVGVHEGTPYLVMELLVGEDLHNHLARNAPLDDLATARLVLPLIAALSAAHEVGVVHRDVKPSNIFLEQGSNGELIPKVLDFGISKFSLERTGIDLVATSPNQLIGSPLYLAPEALRGPGQLGPASDQYSLGVVMYECVTGRTPFQGDTLMALLGALARGTYAPPSSIRPSIAPALERVIERAMSLDPKDRFPSLREMGSTLLGLAAARTQVVWASSFKKPPPLDGLNVAQPGSAQPAFPQRQFTQQSGAQQPPSQPLANRPPSGRLALRGPASTPLPPLRSPLLKGRGIAVGALALVGAVAIGSLLLVDSSPKGARSAPTASAPAASAPQPAQGASSPASKALRSAENEPGVALVPGPLPVEPSEREMPGADSAQMAAAVGKALGTRVHALQPSRRKSATAARERRSRSRRTTVTEAPAAGRGTETSETTRASQSEAKESTAPADRAPSSASGAPRQGANQSPYLD